MGRHQLYSVVQRHVQRARAGRGAARGAVGRPARLHRGRARPAHGAARRLQLRGR